MNKIKTCQKIKENRNKLFYPFTWRTAWIRPYESLYSVYRMFTRINVLGDSVAPKIVTNGVVKASASNYLHSMLGYACNEYDTNNFQYKICIELSNALSAHPSPNTERFPKFYKDAAVYLMSGMYKYCPKCLDVGYHSWVFQYVGVKKCPIHNCQLLENTSMFIEPKNSILDVHPALKAINTVPIAEKVCKIFGKIKEIQVIKPNRHFNWNIFSKKIIDKPLLEVGEEIYSRKIDQTFNVKDKMKKDFYKAVKTLQETSSISEITDDGIELILQHVFDNIIIHRDELDPYFENTYATELQVYISIMNLKIQCTEKYDDRINKLLNEYMVQVQAVNDPLSFYKMYHRYTYEIWDHVKTAAYIEQDIIINTKPLSRLSDNDIILLCIDDHIKIQWENFKKVAINNEYDVKVATSSLPHLSYMVIIDADDIIHLKRLVE